ncbi:hypothetical protein JHK84_029480 [Glycine max]|nr:hypothetical protein JHK84_029480 [Glycine max]
MESFGSGRTDTLILKRFVWPHRGTRVFLGGSFTSYSDADAHYTRLRDQSLSFLISTTQRSPLGVLMRQDMERLPQEFVTGVSTCGTETIRRGYTSTQNILPALLHCRLAEMDAFWALVVASSYTFEEGPKAGTTAEALSLSLFSVYLWNTC